MYMGITVFVLGAVEASVRFAANAGKLPDPEPYLWHRREVFVKIHQLADLTADEPVDILFLGSSLAYSGINPAVFNETYKASTGDPVRSYNAGLSAISMAMNIRFYERVFSHYSQSRVIFLVLSPRDLNQNSIIPQGGDQEVLASANGQALLFDTPEAQAVRFLLEYSTLYRYRDVLMLGLLNGFDFPESLPVTYNDPAFDALGYVRVDNNLAQTIVNGDDPDPDDFARLSLANFETTGSNFDALERFVCVCQEQNIQLVLVNMPMTEIMQQGFDQPEADYQSYLNNVNELVRVYRVAFWDFNADGLRQLFSDQDFNDPAHLNAQGAEKFSVQLSKMYVQFMAQLRINQSMITQCIP